MKQLKFMLAAATAIGLATAAQAAALSNTPLVNDTFDSATLPAGYSYDGDVEADNESEVKDGVLEVNTGTDPLLRALDFGESAGNIDLAADNFDSLVIDTMVQFTVTPASDLANVEPSKDEQGKIVDKIMIYLAEATNDVGGVTGTNLVVKAAKYTPRNPVVPASRPKFDPVDAVIKNVTVVPNAWYRLVVTSKKNSAGFAQFTIQLAAENQDLVTLKNEDGLVNTDDTLFPALTGLDGANPTDLTYVGFAGEGKVDDLKVNLFELSTSLDFTLELGENVSAVSWTVNGAEQESYTFSTEDPSVADLEVVIKSVTYAPGYAGTQDWIGWETNVAESTTITIEATKFADVTTNGETTQITPTATTIADAANGAFECPASDAEGYADAVAKLGKAVTWATSVAKKSYNDAMTFINDMDFDSVTTNDVDEAAYLFNCAPTPEAVATEAAAFTFPSFTKDMTLGDMKAAIEEGKSYNGTVQIHGATTLEDGGDWANGKSGFFYKAVLVK